MAFNGSTHYPPGTLIEFFQRLGMDFGGDTNAYTSFDRTVYMLDLPDTKPETLAEGLRVLADYAGHLLLLPEEINRERGVILSEKLARDSADYRAAVAGYTFFYKGTLLPERLPIGIESVIKESGRERFADFYDTWYRPERLAVIAVGDFDPAVLEKQLRENFGPLAARAPARATPDLGTPDAVTPGPRLRLGHHFEPEASATSSQPRPCQSPASSSSRLRSVSGPTCSSNSASSSRSGNGAWAQISAVSRTRFASCVFMDFFYILGRRKPTCIRGQWYAGYPWLTNLVGR
jgi:zinc protease